MAAYQKWMNEKTRFRPYKMLTTPEKIIDLSKDGEKSTDGKNDKE